MQKNNDSLAVLRGMLTDGTVAYQPVFAKTFRSVSVGVYLSQMFFWQENSRFRREETHLTISGKTYVFKPLQDVFDETGLTPAQQDGAKEVLRESGVLLQVRHGMPAKPYVHISIEKLVERVADYLQNGVVAVADGRVGKVPNQGRTHGKFTAQDTAKYGAKTTVNYRPLTRQNTVPRDGNLPHQDTVNCGATYIVESIESIESIKERERADALPSFPPLEDVFSFGANKSLTPVAPPPSPRAPLEVTTYGPPAQESLSAPGSPTFQVQVFPPAETEQLLPSKAKTPKKVKPAPGSVPEIVVQVVRYFNEVTGKTFKPETKQYAEGILARHKEGATLDEMKQVIDRRKELWGNDDKMRAYLDPVTLFRPGNFNRYLVEAQDAAQRKLTHPAPAQPNPLQRYSPVSNDAFWEESKYRKNKN